MVKGLVSLLLYPVLITGVLFAYLGIVEIKKPTYSCFHGKSFSFGDKTPILTAGNFVINARPLNHSCPEDERYDPETMYKCGYQRWCHGQDPNEA